MAPAERICYPAGHAQLLKSLREQVTELGDRVTVLRECLDEAGVLREVIFFARLHRLQFERACRLHPWSTNASMVHVLRTREMALGLAACMGPPALVNLAASSRGTDAAVADIATAVNRIFPRQVCVCGGIDIVTKQRLRSAECFDLVSGTWAPLPPMAEARSGSAAAVAAGTLYVCGGKLDNTQCSAHVERFDPGTHAWTAVPALPHRCSHAAAAVVGGCLVVCGGFDGMQYLASASRLRPDAGRWEQLPPMSERRSHAVAASIAGRLYVCGGKGESSQRLRSGERFDSGRCTWEPLPPMLENRSQAAAAVVAGSLYVCGGFDGFHHLFTMERLDCASRTWRSLPSMAERRSSAVAAPLVRCVYVCGGFDGAHHLRTAEVFHTVSQTWARLPQMQTARAHAAGAALWSLPRSGSLRRLHQSQPSVGGFVVEDL